MCEERLISHVTSKAEAPLSRVTYYVILAYSLFADIFYIIGGSTNPRDNDATSYEVTTVNLKTGKVGEAEDTLHATNVATAASSLTRIALCGGDTTSEVLNHCQMYSPARDV